MFGDAPTSIGKIFLQKPAMMNFFVALSKFRNSMLHIFFSLKLLIGYIIVCFLLLCNNILNKLLPLIIEFLDRISKYFHKIGNCMNWSTRKRTNIWDIIILIISYSCHTFLTYIYFILCSIHQQHPSHYVVKLYYDPI